MKYVLFSIFLLFSLSGCVSLPHPDGFSYEEIKTGDFNLASWARVAQKGKPVRIYIEGDGFAWKNESTPSQDPTPTVQTALSLAQADKYPNVIYLARPCQYVSSKLCAPYYWTTGRFDEKVIASTAEAVQKLMKKYQAPSAELIGYSGGGAVAALTALRVSGVSRLATVAGVLDHRAWTSYHKDTPLKGSLNPADFKKKLALIPQRHFVGGQDKVVPVKLTEEFVYSLGDDSRAEIIIVPNAAHDKGWTGIWTRLVN